MQSYEYKTIKSRFDTANMSSKSKWHKVNKLKETDGKMASLKVFKMDTENILQHKTSFTTFRQKTAESYDKHILFTVLCIF